MDYTDINLVINLTTRVTVKSSNLGYKTLCVFDILQTRDSRDRLERVEPAKICLVPIETHAREQVSHPHFTWKSE